MTKSFSIPFVFDGLHMQILNGEKQLKCVDTSRTRPTGSEELNIMELEVKAMGVSS